MTTFDPMDHETPQPDLTGLRLLARHATAESARVDGEELVEAVEVGTWAGTTALVLVDIMDRVFCVDHWRGNVGDRLGRIAADIGYEDVFATFCRNMGEHLYRDIIPCRGLSSSYAAIWPRKVALIFIDGSHEYEAVEADILNWRPHVALGGILCGHDYGAFPGVTEAVDELIPPADRHMVGHSVWWTQVT